jgi:hypothetical protein
LVAKVGIGNDAIGLGAAHTTADNIFFIGANGGSTTVLPVITNTNVNGAPGAQGAVHVSDVLIFSNNAVAANIVALTGLLTAAQGLVLAQGNTADGFDVWTDGITATSHTFIYENTGTASTSELVELVGTFAAAIAVVNSHQITV